MSGIIKIEIPDMERTIRAMTRGVQHLPGECSAAIARAVNRTLESVRAEAVRMGRERYTARAESLRKRAVIRRATRTSPVGVLELRGRKGMSLIHFRPQPGTIPQWKGIPVKQRRPKGGVSNIVKKGGRRKVYAKGDNKPFLAKVTDRVGIFVRQPGTNKLEMLYGPSPIQAIGGQDSRERLQARARETFEKRLHHEVNAILAGNIREKL